MPEVVAERAVDIGPLVQRVHLVHAHAHEAVGVLLERVHQPDRLAVGERQDHVGVRADVAQHVLGAAGRGERARHRAQDATDGELGGV